MPINIALDYDGTASRDVRAFMSIIDVLHACGHKVMIVTMRTPVEASAIPWALTQKVEVFATSRKAKRQFMADRQIMVDIWIDDQPEFVYTDALPVEDEDEQNTEN